MLDAHRYTGWALIAVNAAAGVWCLAAHRWRRLRQPVMWATVIVGQALAFVQATLGAVLANRNGGNPNDGELGDMHALYGFSAIVAVMIMYGYRTSPFMRDKQLVLYGLGSLFIMGLGLRNMWI
jgi:hypothetical protein